MSATPVAPTWRPPAWHVTAPPQALLVFPDGEPPDVLTDELDHRAIGVVYHPQREAWGNYLPTVLGRRYDAFCWFDRSQAVRPLHSPSLAVAGG